MRFAIVIALLALPARAEDGGIPDAVVVERALVTTEDGDHLDFSGGCFLPEARCIATGKELADLRAQNAELQQLSSTHVIVAVVGVVVGCAAGAVAMRVYERNRR